MKPDEFLIEDFNQFVSAARVLVFKIFAESSSQTITQLDTVISEVDLKEINQILPLEDCLLITKQHAKTKKNKKTKKVEYYLNNKILFEIIKSFNTRMVSNILNKLSNDGAIESAFDEEKNDFIFWIPE